MYSEPCARLTRFMMPNTSVSPAAMRNSITPNCRPFSSCSKRRARVKKNGDRPRLFFYTSLGGKNKWGLSPFFTFSPLHLAVLVVRVLVVLEDGLLDAHFDVAARGLLGAQQVEVLDRMVVDVVGEAAAYRIEVRFAHRRHQRPGVLEVALGRLHRRVDQHDAVVALRAVEHRQLAVLFPVVGDVFLVGGVLQVGAPEARLPVAERS